jgi:YHS domain-containing protein
MSWDVKKAGAAAVLGILVLALGMVLAAPAVKAGQQAPAVKAADANSAIEQKTCPVMGGPINKEIYTVYKGKKVYFCCAGCKPKFEKNPEKYISKLPQFTK